VLLLIVIDEINLTTVNSPLIELATGTTTDYDPGSLVTIIPIGGEAKRLLPLTAEVAKPCIRLLNRPIVEMSLLSLTSQGVRNFIFGVKGYTNYRSLYDYFQSGVDFSARYKVDPPVHIKYQPNVEDCGSADSARIDIEYYDVEKPILVIQGDNILDVDLEGLLAFHQARRAYMTIGLVPVTDVTGYGIADIDKDMRILRFVEKPSPNEAPSNLANAGLYLISPKIRKIFKEKTIQEKILNKRLDFGYDLIPYLVDAGMRVFGYVLKGTWFDVGTPERYLETMKAILHGQLRALQDFGSKTSENPAVWIQGESIESIRTREEIMRKITRGKIKVEGPVLIGRHCRISDGARIVESCIDNYSQIGKNVLVERSAVMDRVIVEDNAEIRESIIGRHSTIKSSKTKPTKILQTSVLADDVTVEAGCNLVSARIYPHKYVSEYGYTDKR
jgi:NDP-sugar pyrophosphorylase family protein